VSTTLDTTEELTNTAAALALIDIALSEAGRRGGLLTQEEALQILRPVRAIIDEESAAAIIDTLLAACQDDLLIDRSRLLDPLLDARLALVARTAPAARSNQAECVPN